MNLQHVLALAILLPQAAFSATISGQLVGGGGGDDMSITVKDQHGKKVQAYCVGKCGDWFRQDKDDISSLRKQFVGKKVDLTYQSEKNHDRMAGYGEDSGKLLFVKKVTLLK